MHVSINRNTAQAAREPDPSASVAMLLAGLLSAMAVLAAYLATTGAMTIGDLSVPAQVLLDALAGATSFPAVRGLAPTGRS
jgi:hypothetical protein